MAFSFYPARGFPISAPLGSVLRPRTPMYGTATIADYGGLVQTHWDELAYRLAHIVSVDRVAALNAIG